MLAGSPTVPQPGQTSLYLLSSGARSTNGRLPQPGQSLGFVDSFARSRSAVSSMARLIAVLLPRALLNPQRSIKYWAASSAGGLMCNVVCFIAVYLLVSVAAFPVLVNRYPKSLRYYLAENIF